MNDNRITAQQIAEHLDILPTNHRPSYSAPNHRAPQFRHHRAWRVVGRDPFYFWWKRHTPKLGKPIQTPKARKGNSIKMIQILVQQYYSKQSFTIDGMQTVQCNSYPWPGSSQVSSGQLRSAVVSLGQLRLTQISSDQLRLAQVSSGQIRSAQVSLGQLRSAEVISGPSFLQCNTFNFITLIKSNFLVIFFPSDLKM